MRRLSRELGRSAMAAYWYVSDKSELLDLVTGKLLSRVDIPSADSGEWDGRLRRVIEDIDKQLHHYPGIAAILLQRMTSTDRRLLNGIVEILISAGFRERQVFLSYALIHTYLFGRYQVVGLRTDVDSPDPEDAIAALLPHLADLRGRDFFDYGVDTIIDGLRAQLVAVSGAPRSRKQRVRRPKQ